MKIFILTIMLLMSLGGAGCATLTGSGRELAAADDLFAEKKYGDAVAAYRAVIRNHADSRTAADARYRLAYALAFYDNPQPDYAKALQEFEEFLRLYPDHKKAAEAKNWRQVLRTVERLNKNIEELKRLDIRHEEKRKGK